MVPFRHFCGTVHYSETTSSREPTMPDTLSVLDNRTGKKYEIPIEHNTIKAMDLRQIKTSADDFGLMSYDPSFMNTASVKSKITFIDGDKGILLYRGYPIEELAENSNSFLEIAYLILNGELPTAEEHDKFQGEVKQHMFVHENVKKFMDGFRYDAHPMAIFISTMAAMSTFYKDTRNIFDVEGRRRHIHRIIGKAPTIAGFAHRHADGLNYAYPNMDLSYAGNFLNMMFSRAERKYVSNPVLERAMTVLFILHADHEQNCSANTMRAVGSSQVDPYSATAAAASALWGPLHGGANEAVIHMLEEIADLKNVPNFIKEVKEGHGRLMGFGHRIYKNYDPRARIIKTLAHDVFEVTGTNPKMRIALELERIALEDDYFISRKLYPNVDFYSGLIYEAMGFPIDFYPVLFAIPRVSGWLAQWEEQILDSEQKISRPRQIYLGHGRRSWVPIEKR